MVLTKTYLVFVVTFGSQKLLKGQDNWSLSELVQAIVILVNTHSLCSFVYGCGITPEIDFDGGHTFAPLCLSEIKQSSFEGDSLPARCNGVDGQGGMTELMERMKQVEAEHGTLMETSQEELFHQFEKVESGEGKGWVRLLNYVIISLF